jgi:hypothetical protein
MFRSFLFRIETKIHQSPTIATSTRAATVKAIGRDFRVVSGGGSRSDIQSSPAPRASEQPPAQRLRPQARKIEAASPGDTKNVTEEEAAKQCGSSARKQIRVSIEQTIRD